MAASEQAKENKKNYIANYKKKTYKRISLEVTHEKYAEIKKYTESTGESVNGFIKKAIDDRLSNDK